MLGFLLMSMVSPVSSTLIKISFSTFFPYDWGRRRYWAGLLLDRGWLNCMVNIIDMEFRFYFHIALCPFNIHRMRKRISCEKLCASILFRRHIKYCHRSDPFNMIFPSLSMLSVRKTFPFRLNILSIFRFPEGTSSVSLIMVFELFSYDLINAIFWVSKLRTAGRVGIYDKFFCSILFSATSICYIRFQIQYLALFTPLFLTSV